MLVLSVFHFFIFQGEIDAHEDSFRATDEAGQALLNTGHYASEEVKEKVSTLYLTSFVWRCIYLSHHTAVYHVWNGVLYVAGHPCWGEGVSAGVVGGS